MPHLDADALERNPEGMAFLQEVRGKPSSRPPSWNGARKPPAIRPHRLATATLHLGFRLLAFAVMIAAIARSRSAIVPRSR